MSTGSSQPDFYVHGLFHDPAALWRARLVGFEFLVERVDSPPQIRLIFENRIAAQCFLKQVFHSFPDQEDPHNDLVISLVREYDDNVTLCVYSNLPNALERTFQERPEFRQLRRPSYVFVHQMIVTRSHVSAEDLQMFLRRWKHHGRYRLAARLTSAEELARLCLWKQDIMVRDREEIAADDLEGQQDGDAGYMPKVMR